MRTLAIAVGIATVAVGAGVLLPQFITAPASVPTNTATGPAALNDQVAPIVITAPSGVVTAETGGEILAAGTAEPGYVVWLQHLSDSGVQNHVVAVDARGHWSQYLSADPGAIHVGAQQYAPESRLVEAFVVDEQGRWATEGVRHEGRAITQHTVTTVEGAVPIFPGAFAITITLIGSVVAGLLSVHYVRSRQIRRGHVSW